MQLIIVLQANKDINSVFVGIQVIRTPREKSSGAVIFRKENKKIMFLILHYHFKGDYWDLVRGKMEEGEIEEETAKREIVEETGIKIEKFIEGFKEMTSWFYRWNNQNIYKEAVYFLAETRKRNVKISEEHLEYQWLEYKRALETLTYENSKDVVKKAYNFIKTH